MKRGSKEFYDIVEQFEKDIGKTMYDVKFDKVDKDDTSTPKHYFYNHGRTNDLFHAYMNGYALAKLKYDN